MPCWARTIRPVDLPDWDTHLEEGRQILIMAVQKRLFAPFALASMLILYWDPLGQLRGPRPPSHLTFEDSDLPGVDLCTDYTKQLEGRLETLSKELCSTTSSLSDLVKMHSKRVGEIERRCQSQLDLARSLRANDSATCVFEGAPPSGTLVVSKDAGRVAIGAGAPRGGPATTATGPGPATDAGPGAPAPPLIAGGERIITVVDNTRIRLLEQELQHSNEKALSCGTQLNSTVAALVAAEKESKDEREAREAATKTLAQEQAEVKSLRQELATMQQALDSERARVRSIQAAAGTLCTEVSRA